jgi:hypothetical protein
VEGEGGEKMGRGEARWRKGGRRWEQDGWKKGGDKMEGEGGDKMKERMEREEKREK